MAVKVNNLSNQNRKVINRLGCFSVLEYEKDLSVSAFNAQTQYFMSKMDVRRRQVTAELSGGNSVVVQAGAMQWTAGAVGATSGIKGVGDLLGKLVKGAVTKEAAVKPEYSGTGLLVLEPTYKFILLQDVASWGTGMTYQGFLWGQTVSFCRRCLRGFRWSLWRHRRRDFPVWPVIGSPGR